MAILILCDYLVSLSQHLTPAVTGMMVSFPVPVPVPVCQHPPDPVPVPVGHHLQSWLVVAYILYTQIEFPHKFLSDE